MLFAIIALATMHQQGIYYLQVANILSMYRVLYDNHLNISLFSRLEGALLTATATFRINIVYSAEVS